MTKLLYRNLIHIIEDTVGRGNPKLQEAEVRSSLAERLYLEVIDYNCEPDAYGGGDDVEEEWTQECEEEPSHEQPRHLRSL